MNATQRKFIKSSIQEVSQKLDLKKPIELIEKKGSSKAIQFQGIAFFSGRAGIVINPDLVSNIAHGELEFRIARELSHIKTNDLLWIAVVPAIIGVTTTVAISILFPSSAAYFSPIGMEKFIKTSTAALIGLSVSIISFLFFSNWRIICADRSAFSNSSQHAQNSAPNVFLKQDALTFITEINKVRFFQISGENS